MESKIRDLKIFDEIKLENTNNDFNILFNQNQEKNVFRIGKLTFKVLVVL